MKVVKKVSGFLVSAVFYALFIGLICILALSLLGITPYTVTSGSMEPNIHTGSLCFVNTRTDYEDIEVGDVVVFSTATGSKVTHRVISITDDGFETKGDNNDNSDGVSTTKSNFYGKTLFSIPYLGYAVVYLKQPVVVAVVIILCLGWFAIDFINSKEKNLREENNNSV